MFIHSVPLDACLVCVRSAMAAELIGFISVNVCASTGSAALRISSVAASAIQSSPQQMCEAFIFAECWSTTHHFSTEQIERDRKPGTDTTIKHPVHFQNKAFHVDTRSYFT